MTQLYDAGAFIAAERGDRDMWTRIKAALASEQQPTTSAAVLAQVWRGAAARQANLARLIHAIDAWPLTDRAAMAIGVLLANSRTSDVVDAALMLIASDGDVVYTSDPQDLAHLAETLGLKIAIVPV